MQFMQYTLHKSLSRCRVVAVIFVYFKVSSLTYRPTTTFFCTPLNLFGQYA